MTTEANRYTGGCLCGALRYEAFGQPIGSGHCYCVDCRRASGSGFIPFMGFKAESVRFTGESRAFRSKAANGGEAMRNRCAQCMSLVFGGERDKTDSSRSTPVRFTTPRPSTRPSPSSPKAVRPGRSSRRASRFSNACRGSIDAASLVHGGCAWAPVSRGPGALTRQRRPAEPRVRPSPSAGASSVRPRPRSARLHPRWPADLPASVQSPRRRYSPRAGGALSCRDRNDRGPLGKQPRERDLSRSLALLVADPL